MILVFIFSTKVLWLFNLNLSIDILFNSLDFIILKNLSNPANLLFWLIWSSPSEIKIVGTSRATEGRAECILEVNTSSELAIAYNCSYANFSLFKTLISLASII